MTIQAIVLKEAVAKKTSHSYRSCKTILLKSTVQIEYWQLNTVYFNILIDFCNLHGQSQNISHLPIFFRIYTKYTPSLVALLSANLVLAGRAQEAARLGIYIIINNHHHHHTHHSMFLPYVYGRYYPSKDTNICDPWRTQIFLQAIFGGVSPERWHYHPPTLAKCFQTPSLRFPPSQMCPLFARL